MEVVNDVLYNFDGYNVKELTLREDLARMERDAISGGAVIENLRGDGHKIYYRCSDPHFTLFNHELTEDEALVISTQSSF